jgi:hypothetical protein
MEANGNPQDLMTAGKLAAASGAIGTLRFNSATVIYETVTTTLSTI